MLQVDLSILVIHFVFFLTLTAVGIAAIASQVIMSSPAEKASDCLTKAQMHSTVAKLRLQVFSTKIGKDLLSTYALTPLFSYIHGAEHTWLFFSLTSIIASLQATIKMTIGYTASGAFTQLPESEHPAALCKLNRSLARLICYSFLFITAIYAVVVVSFSPSPQALTALSYIVCFSLITFADLIPLTYEQYLLVTGYYSAYQQLRLIEYASLAILAAVAMYSFGIIIATIALLSCKATIIIAIRSRARTLLSRSYAQT